MCRARRRKTAKCVRGCPWVPRKPVSLRPVNMRGHRAKGMRAPENTNQFLMTEKYRLHALRSDSVDSSTDSDEHELTDMDTYLGAWEDAHGALLDPETQERERDESRVSGPQRSRGTHVGLDGLTLRRDGLTRIGDRGTQREDRGTQREDRGTQREDRETQREDRGTLRGDRGTLRGDRGTLLFQDTDEDSVQYFPSEDDLNLSDDFMDQDFTEFCHMVTS